MADCLSQVSVEFAPRVIVTFSQQIQHIDFPAIASRALTDALDAKWDLRFAGNTRSLLAAQKEKTDLVVPNAS